MEKRSWFIYDDKDNKLIGYGFASEGKARAYVRSVFAKNEDVDSKKADLAFIYKKE